MTSPALFANPHLGLHAMESRTHSAASCPPKSSLPKIKQSQEHLGLSWLVAVTACFLFVGLAGTMTSEEGMPFLLSGVPGEGQGDEAAATGMEAMMTDVQTEEANTVEQTIEQPQEVMELPPMPDVVEVQELPEINEALVAEDLFVVPSAPKVETALRPVDPVEPKPVARTTPRRATSTTTRSAGNSSGAATQAGGTGGAGSAGMASTRGKFVIPRPSYPSSLKALGVSGTVRLSIQVGMSGRPESVSIASSSGSAALDEFAASWVRRNGRGPAGSPGRIIAPLSFVLR